VKYLRGLALLIVIPAVAGCLPPPPPPGYEPPTIKSIAISPDPVSAGDQITLDVVAADDVGVTEMSVVAFRGPPTPTSAVGENFPGTAEACSEFVLTPIGDHRVRGTAVCDIPSFLPSGNWRAYVGAKDELGYGQSATQAPFVVTGGTSDFYPPAVVSIETDPTPVGQGAFNLNVRLTDETLPIFLLHAPDNAMMLYLQGGDGNELPLLCVGLTVTQLTGSDVSVTARCNSAQRAHQAGLYVGDLRTLDAIGNRYNVPIEIQVG
jgi:hypothetical protein